MLKLKEEHFKKLSQLKPNVYIGSKILMRDGLRVRSNLSHLPQNPYKLLQKQKLIKLATIRVSGYIQRCIGSDAINALAICTKEIDGAKGTNYYKQFKNYLKEHQDNVLINCWAQKDSKGDRFKKPIDQLNPDHYVHIVRKKMTE